MKKEIIVGLIAIVAIVALGTVPTLAAEPTLPPGYTWYEDEEFKFKIGYPENWTAVPKEEIILGESTMNGINLSTVGAAMFMEPDTPNIIIGVSVNSVSDVEKLKALLESEMGAKKVIINGREGYDMTSQPMPIVKQRVVYFFIDEKCYTISCLTAAELFDATAELFDEYADIFDTAINSFVIEYPAPVTPTPTPEEGVPGFGAVFAIAGLLAVAYLLRRRG
jgi:PGF-CTERM protein